MENIPDRVAGLLVPAAALASYDLTYHEEEVRDHTVPLGDLTVDVDAEDADILSLDGGRAAEKRTSPVGDTSNAHWRQRHC